ncbi:AI-2E family transporter [Spirosoma fluviale]|uniref:AI-2E family transporter n=1 Tax=Spirosoma fluviale TaxID=1597977 RepID=A0A286G9G9_9BACT|nr:AI-2E family transporter [Spirosoma fluviale]SOD92170.1 protein of unknown function DUF20 [Spirosoma fluviale]
MASSPSDLSDFARRVCVVVGITFFFALLVWLIGASFDVLLLLLSAILIASPLRAAARWLSRQAGWREGIALLVVGLTLVGVLVGLGMLAVPLIGEQAQQLQAELPNVWENARRQLEERAWGRQLVNLVIQSPGKLLKGGSVHGTFWRKSMIRCWGGYWVRSFP